MSRETRETFEERSSEGQVLKSSQTLSTFVWDQVLTTGSDKKESFERTSFRSPADSRQREFPSIPAWAVEYSRRFHTGTQEERQESPPPARKTYDLSPQVIDADQLPEYTRPRRKAGPGASGVPGTPPEGYRTLRSGPSPEAVKMAWRLIGNEYGTETPFQQGGRSYMARIEPHFGPTRNDPRPHWHKGVTLYEA